MRITRRGVALSAMAAMAATSIINQGETIAAKTATADLTLTANVAGILKLELEEADGISDISAQTLLSADQAPSGTFTSFHGTIDFGTVDALGNTDGFAPVFMPDTASGPGATAALDNFHSLLVEGTDGTEGKMYANSITGIPGGGNEGGGLYVIGQDESASTPPGAVRHRVRISGGASNTATVSMHTMTTGGAATAGATSPTDDVIPTYISLAVYKDVNATPITGCSGGTCTSSGSYGFWPANTLPLAAAPATTTNGVVLLGSSGFNPATLSGRTGNAYRDNEWDTLTYAIRIEPAETAAQKNWVVRYTAATSAF